MAPPLHILVTDINHHVRALLKREFQKEGHTVYLAKNGNEAKQIVFGPNPLDLIILDPELPELSGRSLFTDVLNRIPPVQVIVHTYEEFFSVLAAGRNIHFVEKNAASIGPLLEKIHECSGSV